MYPRPCFSSRSFLQYSSEILVYSAGGGPVESSTDFRGVVALAKRQKLDSLIFQLQERPLECNFPSLFEDRGMPETIPLPNRNSTGKQFRFL